MMQYSKGDIIEFMDGPMAIVLNDGLAERVLSERYKGQMFSIFNRKGEFMSFILTDISANMDIWYNILIGDCNAWIHEETLYCRRYGKWPRQSWKSDSHHIQYRR